jgi:hypothetical protein
MFGRYATEATVAFLGGRPVKGSSIMVDEGDLDGVGMTKAGFTPPSV